MQRILGLLLALMARGPAETSVSLDSEGAPWPYVVSVKDGVGATHGRDSYYFKMSPDPSDPFRRDIGQGFAYHVEAGSTDKLSWKTSGWYSFDVRLACDGSHLVRIGNWPRGERPKAEDLAIAFYDKGVLLKSYSTLDLIKDPTAVERSVSHYQFVGEGRTAFFDEGAKRDALFRLSLVDGTFCLFQVEDGSLVAQK